MKQEEEVTIFITMLFSRLKDLYLEKFEKENSDIWFPIQYLATSYKENMPVKTVNNKLSTIKPELQQKYNEGFLNYTFTFIEELVKPMED